jgi:formate-nitrite transporter family protein
VAWTISLPDIVIGIHIGRHQLSSDAVAPSPQEVYKRAEAEGVRRLDMPLLEKVATGFIAGVTIVFGIAALGITYALAEPVLGPGLADVAGALAFGIGLVFLIVGRTELFTENFFGPVAASIMRGSSRAWASLGVLWAVILLLNLVGGILFAALLTVEGALPDGAPDALVRVAEEIASKSATATLARAVAAGALLALLSYMVNASGSTTGRIAVTYAVGFFLAVGPFDHVVVSALHLLLGVWFDGHVTFADVARNMGLATVGNIVGGLLLITMTHTAQVKARS